MIIKFTPKPWKVVVYEADILNFDPSHRQERQNVWSLGGKICELYNRRHVGIEKTRANARLISVAPDMYELLDQALQEEMSSNMVFADTMRNIATILAYVDGTRLKP